MTTKYGAKGRNIQFWKVINAWESYRRHYSQFDHVRDDLPTPSIWGRWVDGKFNPNNADAESKADLTSVIGKPLIDETSPITALCRLDGHVWDDVYTYATSHNEAPSFARSAQKHFVRYTNDRLAHRNPKLESIADKTTRLNSALKIPVEHRNYPDEIFYFPAFDTSGGRIHVTIEDFYLNLASSGWHIPAEKADATLMPVEIEDSVIEQAYVILDVTDDRVLLMPWLYQQGYQYLHLHETFLLSVSRVVIESFKSEDIKVGGIVVHGRDPELKRTRHHVSPYMNATWKGIHAENGVYDLCLLGNNAQSQGAILYCLPAFDTALTSALEMGHDYSCNLFSETGLSLLSEEPLSFINVCDGIEMMHNNFTISTDRHESSKPDLPKWVDTWQDKRKTIQVDLRKANERSSGGRSIITRCVECNQKAYIITPTPNPDIGSADCPTCRGKGTLHFQNLLDGAELQSEFPMAGRR